jgi:hypothetical protein
MSRIAQTNEVESVFAHVTERNALALDSSSAGIEV